MIKHQVQKKRVVVRDKDIPFEEEKWKIIMRHVLGRHYMDLQGDGPAWSFSHNHWDTFVNLVSSFQTGNVENNTVFTQTDNHVENNNTTQTEPDDLPHFYKYNVDESLKTFVGEWVRQHNIEINQV